MDGEGPQFLKGHSEKSGSGCLNTDVHPSAAKSRLQSFSLTCIKKIKIGIWYSGSVGASLHYTAWPGFQNRTYLEKIHFCKSGDAAAPMAPRWFDPYIHAALWLELGQFQLIL